MSKEIGERIRKRREELHMSQTELAEKLGYSHRASINKIELGSRNLTQQKIAEIAKVLRTTPDYIMGWNEEPTDGLMRIIYDDDLSLQIGEEVQALGDAGKKSVLEIVALMQDMNQDQRESLVRVAHEIADIVAEAKSHNKKKNQVPESSST